MVQTRGQERSREAAKAREFSPKTTKQRDPSPRRTKKRKAADENQEAERKEQHAPKRSRQKISTGNSPKSGVGPAGVKDNELGARLGQVIAKYGDVPLRGLVDEKWPTSKVIMAHILNALLSSTRISHEIATATLGCLLEANYHDLRVLHRTSWHQRTEVLTEGGYVRYREKTATYLGDLARLMKEKYDDDATNILPAEDQGNAAREKLSQRLQEIKGIGPTGSDIFLGSIQHFFPNVAPFLDTRSRKTAVALGMGDDVDKIFAAFNSSASMMAKLEVALTKVRLDKRENEFT